MNAVGAVVLLIGAVLCVAIEDGELLGIVPMASGVMMLAVAKRRAKALELAKVKFDKGLPPPSRNALLESPPENLSPEVKEMLEKLARKPRH